MKTSPRYVEQDLTELRHSVAIAGRRVERSCARFSVAGRRRLRASGASGLRVEAHWKYDQRRLRGPRFRHCDDQAAEQEATLAARTTCDIFITC